VEKLLVNESFAEVNAGDPLVQIYSPELYSTAQELLIARRGTSPLLAETAAQKLRLLGVADEEIEDIIRSGKVDSRLVLRSPHSGHVFDKRIVEGDHVDAGQLLFDVVDLSTVWIEGEVYEKDSALVHRGQSVEVFIDAYPGQVFRGRVGLVHPHVETTTRTVRVRFELENLDHKLRPGMFANVLLKTPVVETEPFRSRLALLRGELATTSDAADNSNAGDQSQSIRELRPADDETLIAAQKSCVVTGARLGSMGKPVRVTVDRQTVLLCCTGCEDQLAARPKHYLRRLSTVTDEGVLAVPEQAIIDTGNMKVVYIEREPGLFEGVAVTLGPLAAGYYPVIDGLLAGDRIAATGAFLVDAETRLNPTASSAYFGAGGSSSHGGESSSSNAPRNSGHTTGGSTHSHD
jgi:Cu(I)/Ag(I) efflux system membrane fusion protein